jgi:hypothetical protein
VADFIDLAQFFSVQCLGQMYGRLNKRPMLKVASLEFV